MRFQEPTLRALVAAGAMPELVALQVNPGGWQLLVRIAESEVTLEKQRGGVREFRSLDAVAGLVASLGCSGFSVRLSHKS